MIYKDFKITKVACSKAYTIDNYCGQYATEAAAKRVIDTFMSRNPDFVTNDEIEPVKPFIFQRPKAEYTNKQY